MNGPGDAALDPALARAMLAAAVEALAPPEQANLRFHLAVGTPICVGMDAALYANGRGAGCPALLAATKMVPDVELGVMAEGDGGVQAWVLACFRTMNAAVTPPWTILDVLHDAGAREAIEAALS